MDHRTAQFEEAIWPHSRAAYNFARWMVRNDHDAEDIVQESFLKALGAIHTLRAGDARPWLLSIVRNTALNFLNRQKPAMHTEGSESIEQRADTAPDPERSFEERSASATRPVSST